MSADFELGPERSMNKTPSRHQDPPDPSRRRGFSLIEVIVVLAMLAIVTLLAYPAVRSMIAKARLESSVQSVATAFKAARYEAIRNKTNAEVTIELAPATKLSKRNRWLEIKVDRNRDGTFGDDELARGGRFFFPRSVVFEAPEPGGLDPDPDEAVVGFTETAETCTVVFRPDGSTDFTGAIRITHDRDIGPDGPRNFEVRISTAATARVVINVWDGLAGKWVLFNRSELKW